MNGHPTNEEREALIAGEAAKSLAPGEADELSLLAGLLGDPSTWAEPATGLEDAIVAAVVHAPPAAAGQSAPSRANATRRESPSPRRRVGWLAALQLTGGSAREHDPHRQRNAVLVRLMQRQRQRRLARDVPDRGERRVRRLRGEVPPRVVVIPQLPAGEYYQAWLKNARGTLVPIGTFSSSDGRVTLWSGVSPKDFNLISVTIEAADVDQASSGDKVLTGEVHP